MRHRCFDILRSNRNTAVENRRGEKNAVKICRFALGLLKFIGKITVRFNRPVSTKCPILQTAISVVRHPNVVFVSTAINLLRICVFLLFSIHRLRPYMPRVSTTESVTIGLYKYQENPECRAGIGFARLKRSVYDK